MSPVELPGTMLSMKFCIEWCRDQGLKKSRDIKILRFWFLGFQGFATYPNFEVLGFEGLATIEILRSWVSRVSLYIKILRSWVSRVLRHIKILRSGFPESHEKRTCKVQDPSRSQTSDSANPGSRIFLGPWHKSATQCPYILMWGLPTPVANKSMIDSHQCIAQCSLQMYMQ